MLPLFPPLSPLGHTLFLPDFGPQLLSAALADLHGLSSEEQ